MKFGPIDIRVRFSLEVGRSSQRNLAHQQVQADQQAQADEQQRRILEAVLRNTKEAAAVADRQQQVAIDQLRVLTNVGEQMAHCARAAAPQNTVRDSITKGR